MGRNIWVRVGFCMNHTLDHEFQTTVMNNTCLNTCNACLCTSVY